MIVDISIYLDGSVEDRLPTLTNSKSPIFLSEKFDDWYRFVSKDDTLTHFFVYGTPDEELHGEDLHVQAERALLMTSKAELSYGSCLLNPQKAIEFKRITDFVSQEGIPYYMTATDETGDELLIEGFNPGTNTRIVNTELMKKYKPDELSE